MSFGYRDEDWVDPEPTVFVKCEDCDYWEPCPCGSVKCDYGWCHENGEYSIANEGCEFDQ